VVLVLAGARSQIPGCGLNGLAPLHKNLKLAVLVMVFWHGSKAPTLIPLDFLKILLAIVYHIIYNPYKGVPDETG
jgi:hypothetical protein